MEKVLIVGASGLVGKSLCNKLKNDYKVYGTYNKNEICIENVDMIKFEIENPNKIITILDNCNPNKIIVALTGDYEKQLEVINKISKYSNQNNVYVYFLSTWNVFDAYPNKIYYEYDERLSDNDYGNFKIDAENLLLSAIKDKCVLLRLPMIWGKTSSRVNKIKESLEQNEPIEIVKNMYLNNNSDVMLAKQIKYIIENYSNGIFHLGSIDEISQFDFIESLSNKLGYTNIKFNEIDYGEEKLICMLGSNNKLPQELQISNKEVIDSLI